MCTKNHCLPLHEEKNKSPKGFAKSSKTWAIQVAAVSGPHPGFLPLPPQPACGHRDPLAPSRGRSCQRDVASRTTVVCSPATLITTPNSLPAPGPTQLPSLLDLGAEPSPCLCLAVSPPLSFSNRHLCTAAPRTPAPPHTMDCSTGHWCCPQSEGRDGSALTVPRDRSAFLWLGEPQI